MRRALSPADWLAVFDHVICRPPFWYFCFLAAYLRALREPLLALTQPEDVAPFLRRGHVILLQEVLPDAERLAAQGPYPLDPQFRALQPIGGPGHRYHQLLEFVESPAVAQKAAWRRINAAERALRDARARTLAVHAVFHEAAAEERRQREAAAVLVEAEERARAEWEAEWARLQEERERHWELEQAMRAERITTMHTLVDEQQRERELLLQVCLIPNLASPLRVKEASVAPPHLHPLW